MKNKITSKDFRVTLGEKVNLKKWPTRVIEAIIARLNGRSIKELRDEEKR